MTPKYSYDQSKKQLVPNPKYGIITKMIAAFGLAGAVNAALHADQFDDELIDIQLQMDLMKGMNDTDFKAAAAPLLLSMKNYFEHFTDDPMMLNLITLGQLYRMFGK